MNKTDSASILTIPTLIFCTSVNTVNAERSLDPQFIIYKITMYMAMQKSAVKYSLFFILVFVSSMYFYSIYSSIFFFSYILLYLYSR